MVILNKYTFEIFYKMELEDIETRMEEYPVTRAMLTLLDALLSHPYPPALGASTRQPGIEPYLQFVRDSVLLRCASRTYKTECEKVCFFKWWFFHFKRIFLKISIC